MAARLTPDTSSAPKFNPGHLPSSRPEIIPRHPDQRLRTHSGLAPVDFRRGLGRGKTSWAAEVLGEAGVES